MVKLINDIHQMILTKRCRYLDDTGTRAKGNESKRASAHRRTRETARARERASERARERESERASERASEREREREREGEEEEASDRSIDRASEIGRFRDGTMRSKINRDIDRDTVTDR